MAFTIDSGWYKLLSTLTNMSEKFKMFPMIIICVGYWALFSNRVWFCLPITPF
jgi:hypothetical protein